MLGLIPADTDFSIFADPEHAGETFHRIRGKNPLRLSRLGKSLTLQFFIFPSSCSAALLRQLHFIWASRAGWPGLDIAFLLDAASYHTDRDTVERIKAGTLQARGRVSRVQGQGQRQGQFELLHIMLHV